MDYNNLLYKKIHIFLLLMHTSHDSIGSKACRMGRRSTVYYKQIIIKWILYMISRQWKQHKYRLTSGSKRNSVK